MPLAARKHKPAGPAAPRHQPPERDRQAARTLATNSTAWRRIRASVLAGEPLCRTCAAAGRVTVASHVDHINNDPSNNDRTNLQPLCAPCHSRKTNAEDGGYGNRKRRDT